MADLIYANGKVSMAAEVLATHPGRIRERLVAACNEGLALVPSNVLPHEVKSLYDEVMELVTANEYPSAEGAFAPAIRNLTEEEAQVVANRILELASRVKEAMGR